MDAGVPPTPPPVEPKPRRSRSVWWIVTAAVLAICGCGCLLLAPAVLLPVFMQARVAATDSLCRSNMSSIATAMLMYSTDFNERLPSAADWVHPVMPYVRDAKEFKCPEVTTSSFGFAMDERLSRATLAELDQPEQTVMLFEPQRPEMNAHGLWERDQAKPPRHRKGNHAAYASGNVHALEAGAQSASPVDAG